MKNLTIHDVQQGTEEWLALRTGKLTASTIWRLLTPTLKLARSRTADSLRLNLIAERITGWSEPVFKTRDMERGNWDEPLAREAYENHYGVTVDQVGFITTEIGGYTVGYSPDGLVGTDGLIEIKSRKQRFQLETILEGEVTAQYMAQIQFGLMVTGREWCDYISFSGGMPLYVKRVLPDVEWQNALYKAVIAFETTAAHHIATYQARTSGLAETERPFYYEDDNDLEIDL